MKPIQLLILSGAVLVASSTQGALLTDAHLFVSREVGNSVHDIDFRFGTSIIVGPEVELERFGADPTGMLTDFVSIDVTPNRVIITALADQPFHLYDRIELFDYQSTIPNFNRKVSINPATTWSNFHPLRLLVGGSAFSIVISELAATAGQQIILDVVPEPASAALAATACAALALRKRKGRRSTPYRSRVSPRPESSERRL